MADPPELQEGLRIGEALKRSRTRQGIDIRSAEQKTKIRARYLRALEAEQWDVLPSPAYAKGFLRTYATMLGLDGDAFADEWRRQVESRLAQRGYTIAEPVLEHRRRPGEPSRRRPGAGVLAALAAGLVALVVALGLGGDDGDGGRDGRDGPKRAAAGRRGDGDKRGPGQGAAPAARGPVAVTLEALAGVELCLVRGEDQAVIDSQALNAGALEGPFPPAERFRLDLESGGAVRLAIDGEERRVHSRRPASYAISAAGVEEIEFRPRRGCP